MEPRRSQRTLTLLGRSNSSQNSSRIPTTSGNKRKASVTEPTGSQTRPKKRAAFGDITNKGLAAAAKKRGKVAEKNKELHSSKKVDDSLTSSSSQVSSESSQGSQVKLSSSTECCVILENTKEEPCTQSTSVSEPLEPLSLDIPAPTPVHERTDLQYNDIDLENIHDPFVSAEYAQDIFNYYKIKETKFLVDDYMARQTEVTPAMRAVLIDWLVEVQENFELNHETLYLATRLVDHYLMKRNVGKEALQLIGAACIFIGCKFDERIPPLVDDFLYICDDAYNRAEFVRMEKDILRTVNFELGMPISYRFLRRFAKAGKKTMSVLTLSRYINETALMSYKLIEHKESLIAAGCLRLAMFMVEPQAKWDDTLIYYSGYEEKDLKRMVVLLNNIMHSKNSSLRTVENKYSHPVFFEVAKKPLISRERLYADTPSSVSDISSTVTEAILV